MSLAFLRRCAAEQGIPATDADLRGALAFLETVVPAVDDLLADERTSTPEP